MNKKKLRLKDSVRVYIVLFITIFSVLTLLYITLYKPDASKEINECLQYNELDYCIRGE